MIAQAPQRRQPSQATRDKAQRLDVLMLTPFLAIVAGDHDDYIIWRDTLECSCPAGQAGITCSHVLAVRAAVTPPPQTVRTRLDYNRTTGRFDVMAGGVVVGEATSYLEVEVRHG